MPANAFEHFGPLRITRVVQMVQDQREPRGVTRRWSSRLNRVDAADDELMGRFLGRVLIADLIADDSVAGVYTSGQFKFFGHKKVKSKIGRSLTESQLRQFFQLSSRIPTSDDVFRFFGPIAADALDGILVRNEALACAMLLDSFNYDRLGFKTDGTITFGMRSDLKVTPALPWTNVNSTPITDLMAVQERAEVRYGRMFNRATMSKQTFRHITRTTEFQTLAAPYMNPLFTWNNYLTNDYTRLEELFSRVTQGLGVEYYDERYQFQEADGTIRSARYWPINKVALTDTADDNNNAAWDFAVGEVVEAAFLGLNPGSVVGANAVNPTAGLPPRGPISYMTFQTDLNPPGVALWGVDVAFPRKHDETASALLTVGNMTDEIPVTEPF
jgi:hypothetical protein